ncbi:Polar-differentiation response regulator divK [Magnetospirillum gryphiswaldense MSR-1 v2]|uniref:Polar-differentiation response regulator divK n=1 Tax=Magnetospirillum gryphiswaldense (strain DSM 6361 / JCM 21280 / NBRC 15271 / MSR-1) TaxID=431944 RepID=V6F7I4_MAGGM|nr:response regulator [Magnetospirillum gryphiswaldense]CDL01307.1 Polar-differentiation response regulator divK [Magnetospirillum gryphiswaldense MSR-1 v2]
MSGTVVIVEDNAMNMKLLDQALTIAGYRTVKSPDGENLVELTADGAQVVLMDIQLPKRSGVDLLKELRDDPRTRTIPVLAVTAFADPESVSGFLSEGFNQVITKPISVRKLLDEVERYCSETRD